MSEIANDRSKWSVLALDRAVAIRYAGQGDQPERRVVCSLHGDTRVSLLCDPLLPPRGCGWQVEFESNAALLKGAGAGGTPTAPSVRTAAARRAVEALVFDAPATILLAAQPSGLST